MMEPVHLYAALLDVLAYRHHLQKDRDSGTLELQSRLSAALKVFNSVNDAVFRVQAISDTIIITCTDHQHFPEFLHLLRDVFLAFLSQGLFVRGGVAYSRHFQSGNLTYSHAVARAHEIESKLATYPRIVIDENILAMYEVGADLPVIRACGLLCVENGVYFLDVLTKENWSKVREFAKQIYTASAAELQADEVAFSKHLRFERYLLSSPYAPPDASGFAGGIATS